jgi:hypothetical protein
MFSQPLPMTRFDDDKGKPVFTTGGVDFGVPLQIIHETEHYLMAYSKGHMTWVARGSQGYYGPRIKIFEKKGQNEIFWPEVREFEYTRETRKETWKVAEEYFAELIKKVFKSIFEE